MSGQRFPRRTATILLAAVLVWAGDASAQLCADNPARAGRPAIGTGVSFGESTTSYGLNARANPTDHVHVAAGYSLATAPDIDDVHAVAGNVGYDRPLASGKFCPWAGLSLSRALTENGGTGLSTSFGITAGRVVHEGTRLRVTPFVRPYYGFGRPLFGSAVGGWSDSYGAGAGTLLLLDDRLYGVGSVSVVEGGHTGLSLQLGWLLR